MFDLEREHIYVKTKFLHGDLKEEIYMTQSEHCVEKAKESLVCKIKKYLCDLKQSLIMSYQKFDYFVLGLWSMRSNSDHCMYYKQHGHHFLVITLYIDVMLLFGNNKDVICEWKSHLLAQFDMDLGVAKYILGMDIKRYRVNQRLWLSENKYVNLILQHFCIANCRPLSVLISMGTKILV